MLTTKLNLYQQVVDTTATLLGPASQRFIDRQIHNHLKIDPQDLTQNDLAQLSDWLHLSVALLTEDPRALANFTKQIKRLSQN